MTQYSVLDEVYVPFKPVGRIAEMDLTKAIKTISEGVDRVFGTLGKEVTQATEPAFRVLGLNDGLLHIEVYDTKDGKSLNKILDEGKEVRYSCFVEFGDATDVPTSFSRFYADVEIEEVELKSDILVLPGIDFDVDKVLES